MGTTKKENVLEALGLSALAGVGAGIPSTLLSLAILLCLLCIPTSSSSSLALLFTAILLLAPFVVSAIAASIVFAVCALTIGVYAAADCCRDLASKYSKSIVSKLMLPITVLAEVIVAFGKTIVALNEVIDETNGNGNGNGYDYGYSYGFSAVFVFAPTIPLFVGTIISLAVSSMFFFVWMELAPAAAVGIATCSAITFGVCAPPVITALSCIAYQAAMLIHKGAIKEGATPAAKIAAVAALSLSLPAVFAKAITMGSIEAAKKEAEERGVTSTSTYLSLARILPAASKNIVAKTPRLMMEAVRSELPSSVHDNGERTPLVSSC